MSAQPRARGRAYVSSKQGTRGSQLDGLHQSGALKLLFPHGRSGVEAVLINTAGGITGGDCYQVEASAGPGTLLTLTTQAAERAYRAQPGETGQVETTLHVASGARLNWLPQETILFDGCRYARSLRADLTGDARLLLVEPLVFGRAAMGETLTQAHFHDRIDIRRDGARLFFDATRVSGNIAETLARPAVANGAGAMVSLIFAAPEAESHLGPLRAVLPSTGGATLLAPDLLYMRLLAEDSFALRQVLLPILDRLTGDGLPLCWRL